MSENTAIDLITRQDWLDAAGDRVQPAILNAFEAGGEAGQEIKNFLHGTWLGHPLHPVITDVPIGAWTTAAVLDGLELMGEKKFAPGADAAIAVGLAGAVGAAVTGITDWTGTTKERRKIGLMHGLLNSGAAVLYATSLVLRRRENSRKTAIGLSMLGYGIAGAAAYLGGHLVYGEQVGVDHTATAQEPPRDFVAVLPENELSENTLKCARADGVAVMLARLNGNIYALANTCSHLGGPLCEGEIIGDSVRCPWHGSRFSLEDGSVIDGPSTYRQPSFETRVQNGQIEVRMPKN